MYDDDHDALAAEYVLGTLSAAEREQAEALLARDAGFAPFERAVTACTSKAEGSAAITSAALVPTEPVAPSRVCTGRPWR